MKVCFITPSFSIGGYEKFLLNLMEGLEIEKVTMAFRDEGPLKKDFEKVSKVKVLNVKKASLESHKIAKALKEENPHIVYVTFYQYVVVLSMIKKLYGLKFKLVVSDHLIYDYNNKLLNKLLTNCYNSADSIVAVSEITKKNIENKLNIKENKINVIYNPVIGKKTHNMKKEDFQHKWFGKYKIILCVGRMVQEKGFQDVLMELNKIREATDCRVILVGDGPYKETLINISKEQGIEEYVDFLGAINNPLKVMKNSDILILPSRKESFGNVIVEALYCGQDVITYKESGGPAEILNNGKYGEVVEKIDSALLSKKVIEVLNGNKVYKKEECINKYTVENIASMYLKLFKELTLD